MLDLSSEHGRVPVRDGDDVHVFLYRYPSVTELAKHHSGMFERRGNKIINKALEARFASGRKVLTGFEKGSLSVGGKPISSDPDDPDYYAGWKDALCKLRPDVVAQIGAYVFEGSVVGEQAMSSDMSGEEDEDDFLSEKTST